MTIYISKCYKHFSQFSISLPIYPVHPTGFRTKEEIPSWAEKAKNKNIKTDICQVLDYKINSLISHKIITLYSSYFSYFSWHKKTHFE